VSAFEAERREAARLTWLSHRVPVGSILLGSAAATILASAVLTNPGSQPIKSDAIGPAPMDLGFGSMIVSPPHTS
jgi:hypothetical protein